MHNVVTVGDQTYTNNTTNNTGTTTVTDTDGSAAISSDGTVTFNGDLVLDADTIVGGTSVVSGTGATFARTVNSSTSNGFDLTVNMGDTRFNNDVGNNTNGELGRLVTDATGVTVFGGLGGSDPTSITVRTLTDQSYADAVELIADLTLDSATPRRGERGREHGRLGDRVAKSLGTAR